MSTQGNKAAQKRSVLKRLAFWRKREIRDPQAKHGPGLFRETYKGSNSKTKTELVKNVTSYFEWYATDGAVRSGINSLNETALGLGYWNDMPETYKKTKAQEKDPYSIPELKLVNELGRLQNFDHLLPNIGRCMLVGGFVGVETKMTKFALKSLIKIIHPRTVISIHRNNKGDLTHIYQRNENDLTGAEKPKKILARNLTWFVNNKVANDWAGLSLIMGIDELLTAKQNALRNMNEIIKRYLAPTIIWKSAGDIDPIEQAVKGWKPGEDIFIGNLDPDDLEFTAQVLEVDGQAKFWEFIGYIDELIWIGLNSPNQKYWRNATQASATKLDDITGRNVGQIQRNVKRGVEAGFYARFLKENGITIGTEKDVVPRINFGKQPTGVEDVQIADFLRVGVDAYYIQRDQYFKILKDLGLEVDYEEAEIPDIDPDDLPQDKDDNDDNAEVLTG